MADIVILVSGITKDENGDSVIQCTARADGDVEAISFNAITAMGASAATVNAAIRDAAVTAAGALDPAITVGALDHKTILGGAVGL